MFSGGLSISKDEAKTIAAPEDSEARSFIFSQESDEMYWRRMGFFGEMAQKKSQPKKKLNKKRRFKLPFQLRLVDYIYC